MPQLAVYTTSYNNTVKVLKPYLLCKKFSNRILATRILKIAQAVPSIHKRYQ
jgi:hypothetical protein